MLVTTVTTTVFESEFMLNGIVKVDERRNFDEEGWGGGLVWA